MSQNDAYNYLKQYREEKMLSQEKIKTILVAAILRYFEGISTIQFVLDLGKELSDQSEIHLDGDLLEATSLLHHLAHQISFETIKKNVIENRLRRILEILTN